MHRNPSRKNWAILSWPSVLAGFQSDQRSTLNFRHNGIVDVATRTVTAAMLRPTTKS
jgi:hypothetical protein